MAVRILSGDTLDKTFGEFDTVLLLGTLDKAVSEIDPSVQNCYLDRLCVVVSYVAGNLSAVHLLHLDHPIVSSFGSTDSQFQARSRERPHYSFEVSNASSNSSPSNCPVYSEEELITEATEGRVAFISEADRFGKGPGADNVLCRGDGDGGGNRLYGR